MNAPRVVCAGEVMLERSAARVSSQIAFGGDTFNTAVYLARAGLHVDYLTCLGDDADSRAIVAAMEREGIGTYLVNLMAGGKPGSYVIETDAQGERRFRYDREHSPARQLFDQPVMLAGIDMLYLSGITLAVTRSGFDNLLRLLVKLEKDGCRIAFDPNYRAPLWRDLTEARRYYRAVLPCCHVVLATLDDERSLWDVTDIDACRAIYADYNVDEVVIKGDDLTVHAWADDEHAVRRARRVAAVDTTGAGDAFNAAYLGARLRGATLGAAIAAGQQLAARVVQHHGAILPRASA